MSLLSAGQRGLWFLNEMLPDSPAYNTPWWCRFRGPLDIGAMRSALGSVVARHAILRSQFRTVEGMPIRTESLLQEPSFDVLDLSADPHGEVAARAAAERAATRRIDPRSEVLRLLVIRLSEDNHLLVVNAHHLVFDGVSSDVLLEEMGASYSAAVRGEMVQIARAKISYTDFVSWEAAHLRGAHREKVVGFWRKRLAGVERLRLPGARDGENSLDRLAGKVRSVLPRSLADQVDAQAPDPSSTRFMVLLTVFLMLLHRSTGQNDLCLGTPVSHRPRPEHERIIGYFVNTLVLRFDLSGDPSFRNLLARVRSTCLEAYQYQDLPLNVLVEELGREASPRIDATFSVDRAPGQRAGFESLVLDPGSEISTGAARFDLVWLVEDMGTRMEVAVDYSIERFDDATVQTLISEYTGLIGAVCAQPDLPLSRLRPVQEGPEPTLDELTLRVRGMFAQTFGVASVPPDADFFELGGHSTLAAELTEQIRTAFGAELSLREFFEEATAEAVAARIQGRTKVPAAIPQDQPDEASLGDLLRAIEDLPDEEIDAIVTMEPER